MSLEFKALKHKFHT